MASLKDELRAFGKRAAHLAMPDKDGDRVQVYATGSNYWKNDFIAPFDGYFFAHGQIANGGYFELGTTGVGMITQTTNGSFRVFAPVRKGNGVSVGFESNGTRSTEFLFVPLVAGK